MAELKVPAPAASAPADGASASRRPRRVKRALAVSALALGLAGAGAYVWLAGTSGVDATGEPECAGVASAAPAGSHAQICDVLKRLTEAWGRGDADAYGALFTEDATYTTYVGTHYQGRRYITEAHRALFGGFLKGTRLADSYLGIRFYGPGTAIVTSRGDTYKGESEKPGKLSKTQTYTLVREGDGAWRIAAFHNTKRQSVMERISFWFAPDTRPEAER
ncbi:SgcJ/EcaC family oxidoreductase [Actinocorallia libanotica]